MTALRRTDIVSIRMVSLRVPPVPKAAGREAADALSTAETTPRRPGNVAEVTESAAWPVSPSASYINGAALAVDGGDAVVVVGTLAFGARGLGTRKSTKVGPTEGPAPALAQLDQQRARAIRIPHADRRGSCRGKEYRLTPSSTPFTRAFASGCDHYRRPRPQRRCRLRTGFVGIFSPGPTSPRSSRCHRRSRRSRPASPTSKIR